MHFNFISQILYQRKFITKETEFADIPLIPLVSCVPQFDGLKENGDLQARTTTTDMLENLHPSLLCQTWIGQYCEREYGAAQCVWAVLS